MSALLDVILPVFLVIGFGYAAARWLGFAPAAVDGLMRFAQNFAVPCMLFRAVSQIDLGTEAAPGLFLSFYIGAFTCFFLGFAGARLIFGRDAQDAVAIGFACLFSNSLLLGVPITERAYGAGALAGNFTIIALHSPLFYTFGVIAMELARSRGHPPAHFGVLLLNIAKGVLRQPLVIGVLSGLVVNVTGLPMPGVLADALDMLVRAAVPAALFGLGGVLLRYRPEGDMKTIAMVCALSVLVHPGIVWLLGTQVFDLTVNQLRSAVMTAAMAPGINAYLFADLYGRARRVNASAVLIGTATSIVTIWVWLHILP
ncbi:AEC family transporter [Fuscovulum blasticum]|uniref:AEC family transporter n=1 Tax=Fuscovulum blasticum TaxID=1075 RepID=UPI000D3E8A73|nr:AEC family transporter [Fuscovulum blasticum]AWD23140.1 malonate transporter [Fuscovulum blasticum]